MANHTPVRNAFTVLQAFRSPDEQLTSIEISRRAKLPRASGHRLVQTLEEVGVLSRGENGRYRLGIMLASLSRNVALTDLLRQAAAPVMRDLAERLNVTVHMGILEGDMVTYIAKVALPSSFSVNTKVGAQLEPYCSGLGKVLLAALPDEALDNFILSGNLVALTPRTIVRPAALMEELNRTLSRGFAVDNGECMENMFCVAAPIRDAAGHTLAAISVTDDAPAMCGSREERLIEGILAAAEDVRRQIISGPRSRTEQRPGEERFLHL